jgi:hypothetical protein
MPEGGFHLKNLLPAAALTGLLGSASALAGDLELTIEIPRLSVAEYHRPYLAVWVETEGQAFAGNLAVWYDTQKKGAENGTTWLKDMRQWWRKSGRDLKMPVDGVSGATRAPGSHKLTFPATNPALAKLAPGKYNIVVEAAREVGGRELIRIPFQWSKAASPAPAKVKGEHELGQIQLTTAP